MIGSVTGWKQMDYRKSESARNANDRSARELRGKSCWRMGTRKDPSGVLTDLESAASLSTLRQIWKLS